MHIDNGNDTRYYRFVPLLGSIYLPKSYVPGFEVQYIDLRDITKDILVKKDVFQKGDFFRMNCDFNRILS